MTGKAVMVLGCTSGAGKSWLATALCRWYARRGIDVAPFKAQNMSNHARVVAVAEGAGEIGSAQWLQALAARAEPEVRMNPVLLKPEADTRSQVVLMGRVRPEWAAMPWRERSALLAPIAESALASLRADHELLIIEGAGSPAEINLAADDYVNTRTALASQAACLLVADIDRGGAFAHLHGTHALMDPRVRRQLRGYVLNKFRGDASLLAPAPAQLQALTGVPTLAVVPMLRDHGLPEEDAVPSAGASSGGGTVTVVATPHASNLDEFEALRRAGLGLRFVRDAAAMASADWLVLPGSKHTRADLAWLRAQGLDAAIRAHAASGRPLIGICGGLQMLGERIADPLGLEGGTAGAEAGLGLLPIATQFEPGKRLARTRARFGALEGGFAALSGREVDGYEIRLGRSVGTDATSIASLHDEAGAPLGWQRGNVLGLYLHGLFEDPAVLHALFGATLPSLDAVFERLADSVDAAFGEAALLSLLR
jgi:adenosylcobyric acid synthase